MSYKTIKRIIPKSIKSYYHKFKKWQYNREIKGDNVYCPICGSRFKYFANYGYIERDNAECHRCGSLERHRLLFLYLDKKLNFFNSKRKIKLLHFAPENFFFKMFSQIDYIEYIPCDLYPENYNYKSRSKVIKVDITCIPFDENQFDFIICNQVLEHIPNDILAMQELFRVMKLDGSGIIQVPIDYNREKTYENFKIKSPEDKLIEFGHPDHVRWYGKDYPDKLKKVGFKVKVDNYIKSFSNKELLKFGLNPNELIYFCEK